MNFALRRRPPLPSGRLPTCPHAHPRPLRRPLLSPTEARQVSTSESIHAVNSSFPPLLDIPEPPAYPCPHLISFDALKPLYERHWRVCASYNNARGAKTVALEKRFTLTKYRHTLEFFNNVMGLQGICAQEKVYPSHIIGGGVTDATACTASPNRCPVYIHDVNVHVEDIERCPSPVSTGYPAFPRDNVEGRSFGYPYREAFRGQVRAVRQRN